MPTPHALIITGYGFNCDPETLHAYQLAGATAQRLHLNQLITHPEVLDTAQILTFQGGFSYGDDTGSGRGVANRLRQIIPHLDQFFQRDTLTLGVCNGFQVLTNLGVLPATTTDHRFTPQGALLRNQSHTYQCQWVHLRSAPDSPCVWTQNLGVWSTGIAHGEGQWYCPDDVLHTLQSQGQIALQYCNADGEVSPQTNPNGSRQSIAGICDPTGRIFGLMPHPERHLHFTNHPQHTARRLALQATGQPVPTFGEGRGIFDNAVRYFS